MMDAIFIISLTLGTLVLFSFLLLREPKPRPTPPPPRLRVVTREPIGYEWGKQQLDDLIASADAELRRLEREAGLDER